MSEGWWLTIAAIVIIGGMAISGAFVGTFQRELSGIEDRWLYRTGEARAGLTSAIGELDISSNTSGRNSLDPTAGDPDGDYDSDGIPNSEDPDPTNPDTDGDGVSDGVEVLRGTDPNDPNDGGVAPPPPTPPTPPPTTTGFLGFNYLVKQVRDSDEDWSSAVNSSPGEAVDFRIDLEVTNANSQPLSLTIEDHLSSGMNASSSTTTPPDGESTPIDPSLQYTYSIPTGTRTFHLSFSASINGSGILMNEIIAYQTDVPSNRLNDVVFIFSKHPSWGVIQPSGTLIITNLDKQVKHSFDPDSAYRNSITTVLADPARILNFRIILNIRSFYSAPHTVILSDVLPKVLSYVPGSGGALMNKLFSQGGYVGLNTTPGENQFKIDFSATVIDESDIPVANWVQVYDYNLSSNRVDDNTPIYFE